MIKQIALLLCLFALWANTTDIQSTSEGVGIIGGDPATAAQFPFATAIYITRNGGTYFCSGALLTNQWILTAAQCVINSTLLTIRVGSNSLSDNTAQTFSTDTFYIHPDYNPATLDSDVGLIKLRMPLTFTDYIKPIALLASTELPDATPVVTYGWGQVDDENAGVVDKLNFVHLTSLSNDECKLSFGDAITDNMVCAAGNYNEGTCRGDLGSPLIQYGGSTLIYHVGISSFISSNGCESTDPSGFTRIHPFTHWIYNMTY